MTDATEQKQRGTTGRRRTTRLYANAAVIIFGAIAIGIVSLISPPGSLAPYAVAGASVAIICGVSFLTFYSLTQSIRDAIAASFVLAYFIVISILLFLPGFRDVLFQKDTTNGVQLVGDLTKFVTIIVSAYFAGNALDSGFAAISRNSNAKKADRSSVPMPADEST